MSFNLTGTDDEKVTTITKLKDWLTGIYYTGLRAEQGLDLQFYNDTFEVKQLEQLFVKSRTGGGRELIDMPVEQLDSAQMVVSRPLKSEHANEKTKADSITAMINDLWIPRMMRHSPNAKRSFLKHQILFGEAFVNPQHNESWVKKGMKREGLPVIFYTPNPMVIYASPNEDENGIPEYVIVHYLQLPWAVKTRYPSWSGPKESDFKKKLGYTGKKAMEVAEYWEYWGWKERYFEADGESLLRGRLQENIYGFPPFVHAGGGLGIESAQGKPEEKYVGRLKKYRDLLRRECAMVSAMDSIMHAFANRSIDVQPDINAEGAKIPENFREQYQMGTGLVHELPWGINVTRAVEELPEVQYFQYLYSLRADLGRATPEALSGAPLGQTGRLQDIAYMTAMKQFGEQVRNTEHAFETAFSMALKMCDKIPGLYPPELKEGDLNKYYEVNVELVTDDPIENDRLSELGARLQERNIIDWETDLIDYQKKTPEEARKIKIRRLADMVTLEDPIVARAMGLAAAKEMGLQEYLEEAERMAQSQADQQAGLMAPRSATDQMRSRGEVETPMGREMVDQSLKKKGMRRSPEGYTRG